MKLFRFSLFFFVFALVLSSCEKEDTATLAKNKALKEKVAAEMKKADAKKKTPKKTAKKVKKVAKKDAKKIDPILANRPNQPAPKPDDLKKLNDSEDTNEKEPVKKLASPDKKTKPATVATRNKKKITLRPAVIQIVTNFDDADATINGLPYPEYVPQGEEAGMVLPAGGPYNVEVKIGDNSKSYELYLKPNETRILFVSSTGSSSSPKRKSNSKPKKVEKKKKEDKAPGKVTVYGKPSGTIMVDGVAKGEKTPGTIEMKNGRHEIQVKYDESGVVSEKKIVRVRSGSKIKLFFRERKK